jgi:hypothetical protein
MAPRVIKLREQEKIDQENEAPVAASPQRAPVARFLLQVDRQTKGSYATAEAALAAGMVIKKGHPVVQVAIYDRDESKHTLVTLPPA